MTLMFSLFRIRYSCSTSSANCGITKKPTMTTGLTGAGYRSTFVVMEVETLGMARSLG